MDASSEIDVCFVLEGTYPFVSGGVSTWVHQAISSMPNLTFAIHYIGSQSELLGESKYKVPDNVVAIEKVFIFDQDQDNTSSETNFTAEDKKQLSEALEILIAGFDSNESNDAFGAAVGTLQNLASKIPFEEMWKHPITWESLQKIYHKWFPEESFSSFFWNTKFITKPLWELLRSLDRMPKAKMYHSVSTGYAGFLAGVAKTQSNRAFLLSEHGIYVRERVTDLLGKEWESSLDADFPRPPAGVSLLRQVWIDAFIYLGKFCYQSADHITSLFERNAQFQIEFGADREKIEIIPNGIKPERFTSIEIERNRLRQENPERKVVGFLGRIVSIKDVRTLIRSARLVCDVIPDAHFLLVGPTDEDEEYVAGCHHLIAELNLANHVTLTGPKKLDEALPLFDIMVLSSISEGLPFAVLESFAASIPVVSTDVGACSELIYGFKGGEGGPGGIVVPIADASALAGALIQVLQDRNLQNNFGDNGKQRTYRHYLEEGVMRRFEGHYVSLGSKPASTATLQK